MARRGLERLVTLMTGLRVRLRARAEVANADRLQPLQESVDALRDRWEELVSRVDHGRAEIARVEDENRRLRTREAERRQEPLIRSVISLVDDLRSAAQHAAIDTDPADGRRADWAMTLLGFQRQALEALRRNDVQVDEPDIHARLDVSRHEVWQSTDTTARELDMRIAEVLRLGFQFADRVIRPAAVTVYRHRATTDQGDAA